MTEEERATDYREHVKANGEYPSLSLEMLERFTLPVNGHDPFLNGIIHEQLRANGTALVIGRFQPLHYGHIYLMKQALTIADSIIIGIGSANVKNDDNPFSALQREQMLRRVIKREGMEGRVHSIVYIDDCLNDNDWLAHTVQKTGSVDVVVGNNEWVNGIFEKEGIPAIRVSLLNRGMYEGRRIRAKLREEGKL